jgi:DnaJ-class molecular chaperone
MLGEKYYKILGLDSSASDTEVKKKFRELAKKYHPDKNPSENSKERFQEIQDAYERILKRIVEKPARHNTPNPKTKEQQFPIVKSPLQSSSFKKTTTRGFPCTHRTS